VNQNDVLLSSTGATPTEFTGTGNLIEIDAASVATFMATAAPTAANFTLNTGAIATWFVDPTTKYGMGDNKPLPEASQKVTLVVSAAPFTATTLTIDADVFDVGSQPLATGKPNITTVYKNSGVTAKKVNQFYATITWTGTPGGGTAPVEGDAFHAKNTITYTVTAPAFSNALDIPAGAPPPRDTPADKVFINWYTVTGSQWDQVAYTRNTTKLPTADPIYAITDPSIADLDGKSAYLAGPVKYVSTLDIRYLNPALANLGPSGQSHGSLPYGKTYGVIISPGASNYPVLFVEDIGTPRAGEKALSQRIVGVVQD
jgi:hypothetical protein